MLAAFVAMVVVAAAMDMQVKKVYWLLSSILLAICIVVLYCRLANGENMPEA